MKSPFDPVGILLLLPFGAYVVARQWFPWEGFTSLPFTLDLALAAVALLPWLKLRLYQHVSLWRVIWVEATALTAIAAAEWLIYRTGLQIGNVPILVVGVLALIWFAVHERRKNQLSSESPANSGR